MVTSELLFLTLALLFVITTFLTIALLFYIGRTRIKEIDKVVYGFEMSNDSIFFLVFRVPNYSLVFLWKMYAKRSGLEGKIEHFDGRFRWPFITVLFLSFFGIFLMIAMMLLEQYMGIE